ncbi:MAG: endopeptidase La [Alphaproteobacteria bacterium]|uniref:Lon protease n=1 Tax=PS1 clade bacterium TaxID=2175152 RepID=A0A368DPA8_9PROT|nr:endopeptidase La [Rhodobiaceae bacterium]OUT73784.1 MAG: endopeptidase La [Rhizobiales bacterium TMED25]RCL73678.1 MAG: endopeptidase La [PS1 clade bacterium]|tara:strand:+ start:2136 stop:4556 length:2421 start_codon:yes stop_codon:yes gene_type:complete
MKDLREKKNDLYPILPLRDIVVYPNMVVPLFVGREKSIQALEEVMNNDRELFLVSQVESVTENPSEENLYQIGTIASIMQLLKLPDNTVKVLVEGTSRAKIKKFVKGEKFHEVEVDLIEEIIPDDPEIEAIARSCLMQFESYTKINRKIPTDTFNSVSEIDDYSKIADTIASNLQIKLSFKQKILETNNLKERFELILGYLEGEIDVLQTEKRIRGRVKRQMEKTQREYYLNEQMKAIQKELGKDSEDGTDDLQELEKKLESLKLPKDVREKTASEFKKLKQMSPMSAEATVVRNYLDWIVSIPWSKKSRFNKPINYSENVLDNDHFGLEKVKERIIEYIAVQKRTKKLKGPILCLVGPPGVGKTSLGKSIAQATGRDFVRVSLGGVRDEAEIRGHRRTYIGSLPGRIIQSMKKVKSKNPLFLLDEIDKLGSDYRGDPSSALLEVLDPEQNDKFNDHYLEVDYDLSDIMFITTANTLNIPPALMDRMEIIRIAGYTENEKLQISKKHLLPKVYKQHSLSNLEMKIDDDGLLEIIRRYTKESGVRSLERELSKIARKATKKILSDSVKSISINKDNVSEYLGVFKYRYGEAERDDQIGIVTGLAWTEYGGELLTIEGATMPGKGRMTVTGNLKDVMKESISAAASYVRSNATKYGIQPPLFDKRDVHVHVPEGATPKDGPSAGVAMATAIISLMTQIPVRKDIAMTGEITLRGRVLPIGGLKEKLLAASRGGIKTVFIPEENKKDLSEISDEITDGLNIIPVTNVEEIIQQALTAKIESIEWSKEDIEAHDQSIIGTNDKNIPSIAH